MPPSAQHSAASHDWGTNPRILAFERAVLGPIDVDPCSSVKWNAVVGARRFIDAANDGRRTAWAPGAPPPYQVARVAEPDCPPLLRAEPGRIYTAHVNAPGDKRKTGEKRVEFVKHFWRALAGYVHTGWISAACYVGFNVEQLARLQRVGAVTHPLWWWTLIPAEREPFMLAPGVAGEDPSHASFVTLVGGDDDMVQRFHVLGEPIGAIARTGRPA